MRNLSLLLNGRTTTLGGIRSVVKNKTACEVTASNYWSSSEYNSNNTWNVNFNNGNVNNNNKYNSMALRAVAALSDEEIIEWITAFNDCGKNKKTSKSWTLYRLIYEEDLLLLLVECKLWIYNPRPSSVFIVIKPNVREIFAADPRDRVVQHWICLRISSLIENRFLSTGNVSYNCRKGYGTLRAVEKIQSIIKDVSCNYTNDAVVMKMDFKSFFNSIKVDILWSKLKPYIEDKYDGNDIEFLLYLIKCTIYNEPQVNAINKSDASLWSMLNPEKSKFNSEKNTGMPIGNITSQILANFFLSFYDEWAIERASQLGGKFIRFVDDIISVFPCSKNAIVFFQESRTFAEKELCLAIHKNKFYIQPARHGVKAIGSVVRPFGVFLSNRTYGSFECKLMEFDRFCKNIDKRIVKYKDLITIERYVCTFNSYLGFTVHVLSYAMKRRMFAKYTNIFKVVYFDNDFSIMRIKNDYKLIMYFLYETRINRETQKG